MTRASGAISAITASIIPTPCDCFPKSVVSVMNTSAWRLQKADEIADGLVAVLGVAERQVAMDDVLVPAADAGPRHVARLLEIVDDVRRRSFRDPDGAGDVSQSRGRVGGDRREHVRVVRHEPPEVVVLAGA